MKYELAKELKDAGFPQGKGIMGASRQVVFSSVEKTPSGDLVTGDALEVPTLEELIEACGVMFKVLTLEINREVSGLIYVAQGIKKTQADFVYVSGNGETPTEAVVRLWLALKKV